MGVLTIAILSAAQVCVRSSSNINGMSFPACVSLDLSLCLQNDLEGNEKLSQAWEIARLRSVTWFEEYVSYSTQPEMYSHGCFIPSRVNCCDHSGSLCKTNVQTLGLVLYCVCHEHDIVNLSIQQPDLMLITSL